MYEFHIAGQHLKTLTFNLSYTGTVM